MDKLSPGGFVQAQQLEQQQHHQPPAPPGGKRHKGDRAQLMEGQVNSSNYDPAED